MLLVDFPETLFSIEDVNRAKKLIERGYRHKIKVIGCPEFKKGVEASLKLIEEAGYADFMRSYIRTISESRGFSQLREFEASLWANKYTVEDPVEAASFFIQKAQQMKMFLEGVAHFTGEGEAIAIKKRIEFLKDLKERTTDPKVKEDCERKLNLWKESTFF